MRRCDHNAVSKVISAVAILNQDGARDDWGRGNSILALYDGLYTIGREDFEPRSLRRRRNGMRILARAVPDRLAFDAARAARLTARYSVPHVSSAHRAWFHPPYAGSVFGDGTVARKLAGAGHVQNGLTRPGTRIAVEFT